MQYLEIFLIAIALSLDAFAISICIGLQIIQKKNKVFSAVIVGLYFGVFQALMPLTGDFLGSVLTTFIEKYAPLISFLILFCLGLNMLKNTFKKEEQDEQDEEKTLNPLAFFPMLLAAVATSIDALAIGVIYSYNYTLPIYLAVCLIGFTTFCISALGVQLGSLVDERFSQKAERIGALILILLGIKFLLF